MQFYVLKSAQKEISVLDRKTKERIKQAILKLPSGDIKFITEDSPFPDEEEAIKETQGAYEKGEYVSLEEAFS